MNKESFIKTGTEQTDTDCRLAFIELMSDLINHILLHLTQFILMRVFAPEMMLSQFTPAPTMT